MKINERLRNVTRLFLDTSPLVYYVEEDARYLARVDPVFEQIDAGALDAVTSPVTLAECLVVPIRKGQSNLEQTFADLIVNGNNVLFATIDYQIASKAAELRARYNLTLTDAFQIATALNMGCDALLTNDAIFKRITELDVIMLDDLESD